MPSNTTKRDTSKRQRRGKGSAGRRRDPPLPLTLVPPSNYGTKRVTMPYSQFFYMSESAAATGVVKYFRLNGPYDVDPSLASGPTFSLAQWAGFYQYYRVLRARCRAECVVQLNNGQAKVSMFPSSFSSNVPSNMDSWALQPHAVSKAVGPWSGGTTGFHTRDFVLDKTYNMWDVLGVPKEVYMGEKDYQSVFNSVPPTGLYLQVGMAGSSSAACTLLCRLTISFELLLSSPVLIGT